MLTQNDSCNATAAASMQYRQSWCATVRGCNILQVQMQPHAMSVSAAVPQRQAARRGPQTALLCLISGCYQLHLRHPACRAAAVALQLRPALLMAAEDFEPRNSVLSSVNTFMNMCLSSEPVSITLKRFPNPSWLFQLQIAARQCNLHLSIY